MWKSTHPKCSPEIFFRECCYSKHLRNPPSRPIFQSILIIPFAQPSAFVLNSPQESGSWRLKCYFRDMKNTASKAWNQFQLLFLSLLKKDFCLLNAFLGCNIVILWLGSITLFITLFSQKSHSHLSCRQ